MNYRDTCPHCGRVTTAYSLNLNEPLLQAFVTFAEKRIRAKAPVKKGQMGLTNSQYGNFQNLRHFNLVHQEVKGGAWEMTWLGWEFLQGRGRISSPVGHMGGMTLPDDHPAWLTHPGPRESIRITDVLSPEWKQRLDYIMEKRGTA